MMQEQIAYQGRTEVVDPDNYEVGHINERGARARLTATNSRQRLVPVGESRLAFLIEEPSRRPGHLQVVSARKMRGLSSRTQKALP